MSVTTSYFSAQTRNPDAVGIVLHVPGWWPHPNEAVLAPTRSIVFGGRGREAYWKLLKSRGVTGAWILSKFDGKVLCCYEKDHLTCHRSWLAEFIEMETGVKIEEVVKDEEPEKPKKRRKGEDQLGFLF